MKLVKLNLIIVATFSTIAAIILLWSESKVSLGLIECKILETIFVLLAVLVTREVCKMDK